MAVFPEMQLQDVERNCIVAGAGRSVDSVAATRCRGRQGSSGSCPPVPLDLQENATRDVGNSRNFLVYVCNDRSDPYLSLYERVCCRAQRCRRCKTAS